jgi:general nucleoside transport system permease protein
VTLWEALQIAESLTASALRVGAPLILAAVAGLFVERSGVVDIGLEGKMLVGAFFAAAVAYASGDPWLGLAAAVTAACLLSALHGLAAVTLGGDQVVSGMAINILAAGLTPTLAHAWFHLGGQTPLLSGAQRIPELPVGGAWAGTSPLAAGALLIVALAWFVLARTRFGLRLRAVGENPHAVDAAGVSVAGLRWRALMIAGVLTGLAGAYLSIAHGAGFVRDMTAGKGFLALAALIFGKWRPVPTLAACLLFAYADAAQARLQGVELPLLGAVPVQFIQMSPYVLTVLLLAGLVGRARAPKAAGVPFVKELK